MDKTVVNQELELNLPIGFFPMDEGALSKLNAYEAAPQWGASDTDRHIIVTVSWKKSGLAALLIKSKEVADKMQKTLQQAMEPYGFQPKGRVFRNMGGVPADGFRYTYTAQGVGMTGESCSVKKGRTFYYIHCYYRTELMTESLALVNEFFESCEWK